MAFKPELAEGENVEHDIHLILGKRSQLRLVLSSHAAYWPGKKTFAVSDPVTTEKAEIGQIAEIFIGKKSAFGSIVGGFFLALWGVAWTFSGYPETLTFGAPQGFIVGGILFAIFGGRRPTLSIKAKNSKLVWTAPVAFGQNVKTKLNETMLSLGKWSKEHSLNVSLKLRT